MDKKIHKKSKEVFLHPGQFYFGGSSAQIGTLLGSCIAICLWHPILKIGGMCHFVLPNAHDPKSIGLDGRYAEDAMEMFRQSVRMKNTTMKEYHGLIYGGGNMVMGLAKADEDTIGMRNAGVAMELLAADKVAIMVVDVGETWSRRISFNVATGEVNVKKQGQTFIAK
jgi:chemotaxis protein CheD